MPLLIDWRFSPDFFQVYSTVVKLLHNDVPYCVGFLLPLVLVALSKKHYLPPKVGHTTESSHVIVETLLKAIGAVPVPIPARLFFLCTARVQIRQHGQQLPVIQFVERVAQR